MLIKDKKIISHELLTEVLGTKAWQITEPNIDFLLNTRENDIVFERTSEIQYLIDADKLGRLCKEWALNNGYNIWSSAYGCECYIDGRNLVNNENIRFLACSEQEAIFKACEWILKEIEK